MQVNKPNNFMKQKKMGSMTLVFQLTEHGDADDILHRTVWCLEYRWSLERFWMLKLCRKSVENVLHGRERRELMNFRSGGKAININMKIDKDRIRHSRRKSSETSKKRRRKIRHAKKGYHEAQEAKEGPQYEAGAF